MKKQIPRVKHAIFIIFLQIPISAEGSDIKPSSITTTDGTTYLSARVVKVEPDGIRIIHESGSCKILFSKLPQDIQKQYSYDQEKAQQYKQAIAEKEAQDERLRLKNEAQKKALEIKLKSAKRNTFKVFNVAKNERGLFVNIYTPSSRVGSVARTQNLLMGRSNNYIPASTGSTIYYLSGNINLNKIVDGSIIEAIYVEAGTHEYITTAGSVSTVQKLEVLEMDLFE
ncbi:MAG: hypothetical protein RLZ22_535 [Verrucomicrobiota bacterium]|jgi:hypothetical protein